LGKRRLVVAREVGESIVNTPDTYESEEAGTGVKPLLRTTNWSGHRSGAFERVLFKVSESLRPLIARHLTEEHSLLFAEPVTDPDNGTVHWYSPVEGEAVSYGDLTPEDQKALDTHVNQLLFDLMELARKLQQEPKTLEDFIMGQLLELQLNATYSEKECLYVVGYQPVFAFWAFESGQSPDAFEPPAEVFVKHPQATTGRSQTAKVAPPAAQPAKVKLPRLTLPSWSSRQVAIAAGVAVAIFLGLFGLNPRATVVSWLDRLETLRASENVLLRRIADQEKGRAGGAVEGGLEAGAGAADTEAEVEEESEAGEPPPEEEFAEPMPPFEGSRGKVPIDKLQGSILLMHFWSATDPGVCGEITSFVSMVTSERFDPLRDLGGEAYLITNEASVEKGNEFLKSCGVQDPYLLRDPEGKILKSIAPGTTPPLTVVFDKLTERTLATYPRRDWLDPRLSEELQRLFLMQAF
jgi:hypothetical protein